jgi:hypothetical protein
MTDIIGAIRTAFAEADAAARREHGKGAVTAAFDLAAPALNRVLPAAWALIPLIRAIILPMVEKQLTPSEYTRLVLSLQEIEDAVDEIANTARIERARITALDDAGVDAYLKDNNLYRSDT